MPDNLRSFKFDNQVFDIPETKVQDFLKDVPGAEEIRSFTIDKDTFDIPVQKVPDFIKDAPKAKPLHSYPDIDFDGGKQQQTAMDEGQQGMNQVFNLVESGKPENIETAKTQLIQNGYTEQQVKDFIEGYGPEKKREKGFWNTYAGDMGEKFAEGVAYVGEWLPRIKNMPYKVFANTMANREGFSGEEKQAVVDAMMYMNPNTSVDEAVADELKKAQESLAEKSDRYNGKDFAQLWKEGDRVAAVGDVFLQATRSIPISLAAIFGGAAGMGVIGAGTAATKYEELNDVEKPSPVASEKEWQDYADKMDMSEFAKVSNSILTGIGEAGSEYLGSLPLLQVFKKIPGANKGIQKGFSDVASKFFAKYGLLTEPVVEGIEEWANQIAENTTDYITGARSDFKPMENTGKSFVYGLGGGTQFSMGAGAIKGIQSLSGNGKQPTEQPTEPTDQPPQLNPRDEFAKEVQATTQQFLHEDGSFTTIIDETGREWQVKATTPGTKGEDYLVYDPEGETGVRAISSDNVKGEPIKQAPEEVLEAKLAAFDQQQAVSDELDKGVVEYKGEPYFLLDESELGVGLQPIVKNDAGQWVEDPNRDAITEKTEEFEAYQQEKLALAEAQQAAQQPEGKPIITEQIGKNTYNFIENENGGLDLQLDEKADPAKTLATLQKEFKDNPDWQVIAEQEQIEVPAKSRFERPSTQTVVKNIQIQPQSDQNATTTTNKDSKTSEIDPDLKQQVESETQPGYTFKGQEIDRETAQGLIEVAALQGKPEKLNGLVINNDEELTNLMQESFPEKKPSYKLGNRNITPAQVKAAILTADTPEELNQVKIANDNQFDELIQSKQSEFKEQADKEQAEVNRQHDNLVTMVRSHNSMLPGERRRANTSPIAKKATDLGYTVEVGRDQKLIVKRNGSEIRYTQDRTELDQKQEHRTFEEYSPEFKDIATPLLSPANLTGVEIEGMTPQQANQAIIDIQAGKKTVGANKLLDEIERIIENGVIVAKGDRQTGQPGAEIPLQDYIDFLNQEPDLTEAEVEAAEKIPDDIADAILNDEITDEQYNELFNDYLISDEQETGSVQETETDETDSGTKPEGTETGKQEGEITSNVPKKENFISENEKKLDNLESTPTENQQDNEPILNSGEQKREENLDSEEESSQNIQSDETVNQQTTSETGTVLDKESSTEEQPISGIGEVETLSGQSDVQPELEKEISDSGYSTGRIGQLYSIKKGDNSVLSTGKTLEEAWNKTKEIEQAPEEQEATPELTKGKVKFNFAGDEMTGDVLAFENGKFKIKGEDGRIYRVATDGVTEETTDKPKFLDERIDPLVQKSAQNETKEDVSLEKEGKSKPRFNDWKTLKEKNPDVIMTVQEGERYYTYENDAEKIKDIEGVTFENGVASFPVNAINDIVPKVVKSGNRIGLADELNKPESKFLDDKVEQAGKDKAEKIEDFGEKIGGARKDRWTSKLEELNDLTDDDLLNQPLSKVIPIPDYKELISSGQITADEASLLHYYRNNLGKKPGGRASSYKKGKWLKEATLYKDLFRWMLNKEDFESKFGKSFIELSKERLSPWAQKEIETYQETLKALGFPEQFDGNLKGHQIKQFAGRDGYSITKGHYILGDFKTFDEAVAGLRHILEGTNKKRSQVKFDAWREQDKKGIFVGKKVAAGKYITLAGPFKDAKEAFAYINQNKDDLLKKLEDEKTVPEERPDAAEEREGRDYRNGKDVTPEMFNESFGFRGVEFGNYVENEKRQQDLNNAYDALMDLSNVLNIPSQAISLGGELGLAFGARGKGGKKAASAHYEPDKIVINLTKSWGAGSLAHEWWHAVDNYFSRRRGQKHDYLTEKPRLNRRTNENREIVIDDITRPEMMEAFKGISDAIKKSGIPKRSGMLDKKRTKDYWSQMREMSARAFESYTKDKLAEKGIQNDYLVSFHDIANYVSQSGATEDVYPYPNKEEAESINTAFDNFVNTVETKEEGGRTILFRSASPLYSPVESSFVADKLHIATLKNYFQVLFEGAKNTGTIHVISSLPEGDFKGKEMFKDAQGFYDPSTGDSYFILDKISDSAEAFKTWVHEVGVHRGLSNIIPAHELNPFFNKMFEDIGAEEIQANIPKKYHNKSEAEQAEEYLAFLGEKIINEKDLTPKQKGFWTKIVDAVKNILNKLFTGVKFTKADAEDIVKAAVQSVYQRPKDARETSKTMSKQEAKSRFLDEKLNNIRLKVIGEQGSANLDKAEEATIRLDNLQVAREMEVANKTPKEIRLATGWEKGADGKWKYETNDIELNIDIQEAFNKTGEEIPITDVINDKELFNAYPELKNTKIKFYEQQRGILSTSEQPAGIVSPEGDIITIGLTRKRDNREVQSDGDLSFKRRFGLSNQSRIDSNPALQSVLSHEIQHLIQRVEGFGRGGNREDLWERLIRDQVRKIQKETELAQSSEERKRGAAESRVQERYGTPQRAYESLIGEVESRNVQSRMGMTAEQRRETLLSETEDVAREDQIFLNDALGNEESRDIRFRAADSNFLDEKLEGVTERAKEAYKERQAQLTFKEQIQKIREFWQDINLPIRKLEEEIKKRGGKQYNRAKPYRDINLSFGRMEELYREFTEEKMKPILDAVKELVKKSNVDAESVLPYIIAKHASERNREMRKEAFDKWVEANEDATESERSEVLDQLDKKDFSGVRGFDPENTYENPDELAEAIVDEIEAKIENKELIGNLWKQINAATGQTLEHWRQGGQISEKMYEKYKNQYDYFVPLRGWRHGAAKNLRYQKGQGFGRSLRHAEGRKSLADNPLAYMQAVAFKAIGEQVDNEIKNSLLNLVLTNYKPEFKDLYHIKKVYYTRSEVYNPETGENEEVWDATLIKPDEEMFDNGDAKSEYYGEHMKLRSKFEAFQHEVIVHREGGDVAIVFDNEQLTVAQAFNRQNTMFSLFGNIQDAQHWNLISRTWPAQVTQFMKQMFTSLNPVFPFMNFFRDSWEATFTMFIQEGDPTVMKNIPKSMMAIRSKLWGKVNLNKQVQQDLRDFYKYGGATGFTHLKTPEQIEKEQNKELRKMLQSEGLKGRSLDMVGGLFEGIRKWNQLFEDTTRFAVYLSSRQAGKTKEDAALDAKEASVNFNRKGKGTKMLDSVWAFFNPAIQAAQKNFKLAKDNPGRFAAVAGSVAMAGFLEALLNDLGDDDDEYYRLNEYVRHNYAVLKPPGSEKYLRIPLPQFWRGFHSLGVITYDLMKGKTDAGSAVANTTLNFIGGLSPIDIPGFWVEGEFSLTPLIPTSVKPLWEAGVTNRNFMQSQIAKEPFTKALEERLANSDLHKKNVNPAIKAITDFLSKDIGGKYGNLKVDIENGEVKNLNYFLDWNPSKIEHVLTSYTGGTGKVVSDLSTTLAQIAMSDQEVDINNIPFINSFVRNTPDEKWQVIREYYDLKEMLGDAEAVKNYAKSNRDLEKYRDVSLSELNIASKVLGIYDKRVTDLIQKVGMQDEEGSQQAVELMQEAVDRANKILEK